MNTIEQLIDYLFYTSVLGYQDYMWQNDMVLVTPSALITSFSQQIGIIDFSIPLEFPSDSSPAIN